MLTNFRNHIDQIDDQLIELLAKRFEIVKQVGAYKKECDLAPLQPGRWQEVLAKRLQKAEEFGLDSEFVVDVWNRIHEYALRLEEKEKDCISPSEVTE
jgi:chorismate mutase-like protein